MSESPSTHTKTATESTASESTEEYLEISSDRWTNNISYRQLVVSSCIGITQLWWHPYVNDLQTLFPFLFLYIIFTILFGVPLFYLELSLGVATKKGVLGCWDMAPIARGVGFAMLGVSVLTALALSAVGAWSLAMLVHSGHSFLPWLHCAASAKPACAARHRPLPENSETPAQSFFFNFILNLKRGGLNGGLGSVVWELVFYIIISWILIYFVAFKRVYSYSKLVVLKDVLTFFVLICCWLGTFRLEGANRMFHDANWSQLFVAQLWREAIEYALIQLTLCQGTLIMLGSYCPNKPPRTSITTLMATAASMSTTLISALTLGAAHGALAADYSNNFVYLCSGIPSSMILWADYVARIPGSQFWSALVFFTLFVLAVSSTALLMQTVMSAFTGRSVRHVTWVFLVVLCFLCCFISIITLATQGGLYILSSLMSWPVLRSRVLIGSAASAVITYTYGQSVFCEDVFFAAGEYPSLFLRIEWALSSFVLSILPLLAIDAGPSQEAIVGWILIMFILMPIPVFIIFYAFFKFRVRDIVGEQK